MNKIYDLQSMGDSGGPLLVYTSDGEAIVVAVVSSGVKCAAESYPGLYVRTSAHLDFLSSSNVYNASDPNGLPVLIGKNKIIIIAVVAGVVVIAVVLLVLNLTCR